MMQRGAQGKRRAAYGFLDDMVKRHGMSRRYFKKLLHYHVRQDRSQ